MNTSWLLTPYEERWTIYARSVLAQDCGCACDDDDLAWPGFIGPEYSKGRILIVGAIHNAEVLSECGITGAVKPAVKQWLDAPPSAARSRQYLDTVFEAYVQAIPMWATKTVWNGITDVITGFGVSFREIAFTNLAKCALNSGSRWSLERRRIKAHEAKTPLRELIAAIEPRYVLVAKERLDLDNYLVLEERPDTRVRRCSNMHFTSKGILREAWIRADAAEYHAST